ncbi:MAG: LysM peptidoglycan-binding domain-containing protein [Desulfuromonadales bacterium]|nr:LysM peptidoglycan-binding domain-containing protein [Desulfuromonadales bacterium]
MNLKRTILTICLLLMIWPSIACAKEEAIIYTVKQGDTLWDISQRFIKDPYYWPNLWSNNPAIGNPHLIYPGQKLRIYDGRIEIIPVGQDYGSVGAAVMTPDELLMIPTYGGAQSFISSGEEKSLGTLVDTVDNRVMIVTDDIVFLEMTDLAATKPGDVFELIAIGPKIFHPAAEKKIGYQLSDQAIGFQTIQLGTVEVTEVTPSVAVATVTNALREIKRGAKLRPYRQIPNRIPRIMADSVVEGYIVANDIGKLAMGQWEIILIDIGEESGLQVGHELALYRQREMTEEADKTKKLILPDIDLGDAIVLEVRQGFAEALITRTTNLPLYRGDQVRTKTR